MTLAWVRRPTCEARSAAWKASPITYTPPWKYRTTWRGSIPSNVISAVGTPPSAAAVTVTSAGSGCADSNSRSSRRCSLTSLPTGKADCRRTASRFSRCSVLTEDLPSVGRCRPSGVHLRAVAEVEPDRLHHPERRALGVDVCCRDNARVLLDHRGGCDSRDLAAPPAGSGSSPPGRRQPWGTRWPFRPAPPEPPPRRPPGRSCPADAGSCGRGGPPPPRHGPHLAGDGPELPRSSRFPPPRSMRSAQTLSPSPPVRRTRSGSWSRPSIQAVRRGSTGQPPRGCPRGCRPLPRLHPVLPRWTSPSDPPFTRADG